MDFLSFLKRIESERKYVNQRFCFVLGAGASYNCGIAKASDLIDEWYGELLEDCYTFKNKTNQRNDSNSI